MKLITVNFMIQLTSYKTISYNDYLFDCKNGVTQFELKNTCISI